jgi:NUMOD1 domain-containing protein
LDRAIRHLKDIPNARVSIIILRIVASMRHENNRPIYCFLKKGTFVKEYPNVTAAANDINYSRTSIILNIKGTAKSVGDFVFSYEKKFPGYTHIKHSQYQVDRFSLIGQYQCTYPTVMEAAKDTGIDYTRIYRCIHEKRDLDTGFYWRYRKKKVPQPINPIRAPNRPKIFQFDLNGKLIDTFKTATAASQKTGIDRKQINRCCLKQEQTAGGFHWTTSYFADLPKI